VTIYLFGLGLLLAQYTITGFDASAHVSEETVGARTEAPKAIVRSIYISAIAALVMNLAMIAAMPKKEDVDGYVAIAFGSGGDTFLVNAAPRLISSAVGSGAAKFLVLIAIVGQFFCGLASVTANSRMIYAFSRDGALPGSKIWHKINKKTRTPTNSVWLGVALSALVGTLSLYQKGGFSTAFFALTGICVIGLYISYAIPIYLRLTNPDFKTGPWNLKGYHKVVGWTALAWIVFISVLFVAPVFWPFWKIWGSDNLIMNADGRLSPHESTATTADSELLDDDEHRPSSPLTGKGAIVRSASTNSYLSFLEKRFHRSGGSPGGLLVPRILRLP
jgi:amino acid transporter